MTAIDRKPTVESIEHLDFVPMCSAASWAGYGCGGQNRASYAAVTGICCKATRYICSECVTWRVSLGVNAWRCAVCRGATKPHRWLDGVTLHPLGGAA